jgi:hypothetical protein
MKDEPDGPSPFVLRPSAFILLRDREETAVAPPPAAPPALGFLTVLHEANGYVGGYLVTNGWGRPLEFRLSGAVQPNRVQQILYAATLQPYVCGELIGKTLVEKTATPVQLIVTDREPVLELRSRIDVPVAWLAPADLPADPRAVVARPAAAGRGPLLCHPRHPDDAARVAALLEALNGPLDLAEPFGRIREAIAEARKLGVTARAA